MSNWHAISSPEALAELGTHAQTGLTTVEAAKRRTVYGPNQLIDEPPRGFLTMLLGQFKDLLILILLASTVIAAVMGEILDAGIILGIVILNAVLSVVQQGRAERALTALRRMAVPEAAAVRDGRQTRLPAPELVPGDIVLIQAGDVVPADLRLLEAVNLKTDESPLTGESVAVEKDAAAVTEQTAAISDQPGMAFLGTTVVYGRGRGVVVQTGMATEIGKIAALVAGIEEKETPLQRRLTQFGRYLGYACLGICAVVFLLGILRGGERPFEMFMTAVSLAVAAIPEGLPATVTIVLALGVQRMIARRAIIRRLPAVETLGCATFICSDKTGTLTENRMTVTELYLAKGRRLNISGHGYRSEGEFTATDGSRIEPGDDSDLTLLLKACLACNDAGLIAEEDGTVTVLGDPTEAALVVLAAKAGMERDKLQAEWPRLQEIPFDSTRKRMTTVHESDHRRFALTKGAPDLLLGACHRYCADGTEKALTDEVREGYMKEAARLAAAGLRVLGLAYRNLDSDHGFPDWDRDLTCLGLVAMQDPIREEARAAVATCLEAGIKPVMVTGDFPHTARAVAVQLGLAGDLVLTGAEIEKMTQEELGRALAETSVFARVSPEHKLRIIDALRSRGEVVAMTGDGVNDAPALRSADIGVAMGRSGTEVAKGASDMIIADDNFATIVAAIEEGRVIFENIRKAVIYLLSCNIGELLLFLVAILAGLPRPLVPVQILLINLVTDGLPALALGVEPKEHGVMKVPPRDPREGILSRPIVIRLLVVGALVALAALIPFVLLHPARGQAHLLHAQTAAFATLALAELWRALSNRSERKPWWRMSPFGNIKLLLAIASSIVIILCVLYLPFLGQTFGTLGPGLADWALIGSCSLLPMLGAELAKQFSLRERA